MGKMSVIDWIAIILLIVGGINWGIYGAFSINLVARLLGMGFLSNLVYVLVGLSALYSIYTLWKLYD